MEPLQNHLSGSEKIFRGLPKKGPIPLGGKVVRGRVQPGDEAAELLKAAKAFEAVFLGQLLKGMRSTVSKEKMFHGGPGEDIFEGMLDDEFAKILSLQGKTGIGEMLYRDLSRRFNIGQGDELEKARGTIDSGGQKFLPLEQWPGNWAGKPLTPQDSRGAIPSRKDGTGAPSEQRPSAAEGAAEIQERIRFLKQQAQKIIGTKFRK